jgi:ribonuclease BN (tRNA processing enzyme)
MLRGIADKSRLVTVRTMRIKNPLNWTCMGYSNGGKATTYYIPQIDTMVDAGIKIYNNIAIGTFIMPKHLLITHNHHDHTRNTNWYYKNNYDNIEVLSPYVVKNAGDNYHNVYDNMNHQSTLSCRYTIQELTHRIPSYSYGITYNDEKQVLFMGDTNIDVLYHTSFWKDYPVIFIECTNYNDRKDLVFKYHKWGHISLADILPFIQQFKDIRFVLTHSGSNFNYSDEIKLNKLLKNNYKLKNVYVWIDE